MRQLMQFCSLIHSCLRLLNLRKRHISPKNSEDAAVRPAPSRLWGKVGIGAASVSCPRLESKQSCRGACRIALHEASGLCWPTSLPSASGGRNRAKSGYRAARLRLYLPCALPAFRLARPVFAIRQSRRRYGRHCACPCPEVFWWLTRCASQPHKTR